MAKIPQYNYAKEARKGRTPISTTYGKRKTSIIGRHAEDRRKEIGQIVSDYQAGRKLPRKYESPRMIAQHGLGSRLPVADAIDSDARPLMMPHAHQAGQPRFRGAEGDMERAVKKGVTRVRTPAQIAAAKRNLAKARAAKRAR